MARGEERRGAPGPQPGAANMRQMVGPTIIFHQTNISLSYPNMLTYQMVSPFIICWQYWPVLYTVHMSSKCFKVITQAHADQCKNLNLDKLDQIYQVWDAELSVVAQAHADQCKFAHDCSDCRRVSRFGVGQNLYIYKQVAYCYFLHLQRRPQLLLVEKNHFSSFPAEFEEAR